MMSTNYGSAMSGMPAGMDFASQGLGGGRPPVLALKRGWTPRVFYILGFIFLVFPAFGGAVLAVASAVSKKDPLGPALVLAAALTAGGVVLGLLLAWGYYREQTRAAALFEEGVELRQGAKVTAIKWGEVAEVFIMAQKQRMGGIIGVGMMIADALKKSEAVLTEKNTIIRVRVKAADGREIKLSNNDKGVVAAYNEACNRVNPRLAASALGATRSGAAAKFGKITLTGQGIAFGNKAPTPYNEITSLGLDAGTVKAKKEGKWLALGTVPVASTPNVYVLLGVFQAMSSGAGTAIASPVQASENLAAKIYYSG
jgi:hypothetical protein